MNKGPNATIRLVRRQNHAGTTVSWTTVQREKNSHAYKLSSNVQTACSTDSLNNCPKHSILRFSSFALKIYLWLKMCQHNLPCSIVLPTACFPEGPSPHFTLCSFWRRRPRLEAVRMTNVRFSNSHAIMKVLYIMTIKVNLTNSHKHSTITYSLAHLLYPTYFTDSLTHHFTYYN